MHVEVLPSGGTAKGTRWRPCWDEWRNRELTMLVLVCHSITDLCETSFTQQALPRLVV